MNIKTVLDLLKYVETEEKAYELIYYISSLEEQLQQKENIIKEVRDYIEKYINRDFFDLEHSGEVTIKLEIKGLLEILDKEVN